MRSDLFCLHLLSFILNTTILTLNYYKFTVTIMSKFYSQFHSYLLLIINELCFTFSTIIICLIVLVIMSTCFEIISNNDRLNTLKAVDSINQRPALMWFIESFSVLSNSRQLLSRRDDRLKIIDALLVGYVTLEFFGRAYTMEAFHGLIGLKRTNVGVPREFFTANKFFWIRIHAYNTTLVVLLRFTFVILIS